MKESESGGSHGYEAYFCVKSQGTLSRIITRTFWNWLIKHNPCGLHVNNFSGNVGLGKVKLSIAMKYDPQVIDELKRDACRGPG